MVERYQVGTSAQGHIIATPSVNGKWVTYEACAKFVAALKALIKIGEIGDSEIYYCPSRGAAVEQAREALREIGEL